MSDASQGPGWWQASDGKWYAPELYPQDWPVPNPDRSLTDPSTQVAQTERVATAEPANFEESTIGAPGRSDHAAEEQADSSAVDSVGAHSAAAPVEPLSSELPETYLQEPIDAPLVDSPPEAAAFAFPEAAPTDTATPTVDSPAAVTEQRLPTEGAAAGVAIGGAAAMDQTSQAAPPVWESAPIEAPEEAPVGRRSRAKTKEPGATVAAVLAVIAGLAIIVGSVMSWAEADGAVTGTVNGLSDSNGWGTLACGVVVVACGVLLMMTGKRVVLGVCVGAASTVALGLAVFSIIDIGNTSDDLSDVLLAEGFDAATANSAQLDLTVGIWVVVGGALIGVIAAAASLIRPE